MNSLTSVSIESGDLSVNYNKLELLIKDILSCLAESELPLSRCLALPGKPSKPMLFENNGTLITLNWLMSDTGGTLITYYLIESNNQSTYHTLPVNLRQWTLVVNLTRTQDIPARIQNLTTNTAYRFRVTPFNSVGRGPTSNVSEDIITAESGW